jgi:hypothetical protein
MQMICLPYDCWKKGPHTLPPQLTKPVNRKFEVAVAMLEDLSEQIERHRLEGWESPKLVSHVWYMLRRCYLLMGPAANGEERSAALLRKLCPVNPAKALE